MEQSPSPRHDPKVVPDRVAAHLAGARPSPQSDGPGASLFILQVSFDDEHAHQRAADLRRQIREDLRWAPLAFTTLLALALAAAALSRALSA
jgi:hypothetical protein